MEWVLTLIGGLGIGSLLTSLITHVITRRATTTDRWYQEKREAYLGLLTSLREAAVCPSNENAKTYALWQMRCDLFGSPAVSKYAQRMIDTTNEPREERADALRNLIEAMKLDLRS